MGPHENLDFETPAKSEDNLLALVMAAADVGLQGIDDRVYQNISGEYGGCSRISHCQRCKRSVTAAV